LDVPGLAPGLPGAAKICNIPQDRPPNNPQPSSKHRYFWPPRPSKIRCKCWHKSGFGQCGVEISTRQSACSPASDHPDQRYGSNLLPSIFYQSSSIRSSLPPPLQQLILCPLTRGASSRLSQSRSRWGGFIGSRGAPRFAVRADQSCNGLCGPRPSSLATRFVLRKGGISNSHSHICSVSRLDGGRLTLACVQRLLTT
jgi:hypothetical protein